MSTPYSITDWTWGDGVEIDGRGLRQAQTALVNKLSTSDNLTARGGVVDSPGTPLNVTAYSGMQLAVESGEVIVPSSTAANGAYIGYVPSGATITLTAANATYPRYDRIVVTVTDVGTSGSTMQVIPVDGTPASSPAIPAQPDDSITLAVVYVGAGVVSIVAGNITDNRSYTCAAGGILPISDSTHFPVTGSKYAYFHDIALTNLWARIGTTNYPFRATHRCTSTTRPTNVLTGTMIYETDTGTILTWNGTAWVVFLDVTMKTYTPVWSGAADPQPSNGGTGASMTGRYQRMGHFVTVEIKMTAGSSVYGGGPGTGALYWSLPFAVSSTVYGDNIGTFVLQDSGGSTRTGTVSYITGPKCSPLYPSIVPTDQVIVTAITSAAPVTWTAGDTIMFNLRYEIA